MSRKFVDTSVFESRKQSRDENIDYKYWHSKTLAERLQAANIMTAVVYNEPDFMNGRVDRTVFSARKHKS